MIQRKLRKRTIWVERTLTLDGRREPALGRCDICTEYSQMVPPEVAAQLCGLSVRELFRLVESASLHFSETADGLTLFCVASLAEIVKNNSLIEQTDENTC